ncbi:MAG: hypothetical protein K6F71_00610 [Ruminococcus sp.]|uniref:hypothetical protein n=1 Tax=Ruminococcus sp. TaxID=41978 RepID=UPI0025D5CA30|nr:hypothetical protein [Ruminococcus sp.]MCR5539325.1 hypothetical protein [Ruminococcus sp.]
MATVYRRRVILYKGEILDDLFGEHIQNHNIMKEVIFIIIKNHSEKTIFSPIRAPDAQS